MGSSRKRRKQQPKPISLRTKIVLGCLIFFGLGSITFHFWGSLFSGEDTTQHAILDEGRLPSTANNSWKELDDPSKDGWDSEVVSAATDKVLKKFGEMLLDPSKLELGTLSEYVESNFTSGTLVPSVRKTVFKDAVVQVERADAVDSINDKNRYQGVQGFVDAMKSVQALTLGASDLHSKFKLFRITPDSDQFYTTIQYVALSGRLAKGRVEHNATWEMKWIMDAQSHHPKLLGIKLTDFEFARSSIDKTDIFSDCTMSVMGKSPFFREQFHRGMNHWLERTQDRRYYYIQSHPGIAIGDINGDGLEDMYVCQDEGLPNCLFVQQHDGTAKNVAKEWGVDWLHSCRGALLIDLDNDGRQDLVVATVGYLIIAKNLGQKFEIRCILPTDDDNMSLSAADYNQDGKLDLYVCAYNQNNILGGKIDILGGTTQAVNGKGGGRNVLFRNDIANNEWRFSDVTKDTGLEVNNWRYSFGASWEDFDDDGSLDLYVANDFGGGNNLYRNVGGKFVDVAPNNGSQDQAFSMSAAWGDYNLDGRMDLLVGNMFSGAGNRITFNDRFMKSRPDMKALAQRFARGNTLLKNSGDGTFSDVSNQAAITVGRWAWSTQFLDINNDCLEDIFVANGYITAADPGDL